jgi:hypothetical protein
MVKEDEEKLKKKRLSPESKKRKAAALKQKATDFEEETPVSSSVADVAEILKVMTESLPIKLSPLAPHLTKLFQKGKEPSAAENPAKLKKRRIIQVADVIHQTPPLAPASKIPTIESAGAAEAAATEAEGAKAKTAEDSNLETTFADINNMLLNAAAEEAAAAAEGIAGTTAGKGKQQVEDTSEEEDFNFQDILGQELSKTEKEELREYAISCGYKPGALLFGGVNEGRLKFLRDRTRAKVVSTLSKSVGLLKIEADLCR